MKQLRWIISLGKVNEQHSLTTRQSMRYLEDVAITLHLRLFCKLEMRLFAKE